MASAFDLFDFSMDEESTTSQQDQTTNNKSNVDSHEPPLSTKKTKRTSKRKTNNKLSLSTDKENSLETFDFSSTVLRKTIIKKRLNVNTSLKTTNVKKDNKRPSTGNKSSSRSNKHSKVKDYYNEEFEEELKRMANEMDEISNYKLIVE